MPVHSMTGYASAQSAGGMSVECRSVNGRFLDLHLKLPEELRGHEPAIREWVGALLKRGKVELRMNLPEAGLGDGFVPSAAILQSLSHAQARVLDALPLARVLSVHEILSTARALAAPAAEAIAPDQVRELVQRCLHGLQDARQREGARLVSVLLERVDCLEGLAAQAEPLVPQVVARQRQRFLERWSEALQAAGLPSGPTEQQAALDRALSEAAAFAIRIDVDEELARLRAHLAEIRRLLQSGGELGKRLDFLIQELHREANTLGSKSAAMELTTVSVDMKVAIEQMREQVQNIE